MKINIKSKEVDLVCQGLMDVIVNSPNFKSYEKEALTQIYHRIRNAKAGNKRLRRGRNVKRPTTKI